MTIVLPNPAWDRLCEVMEQTGRKTMASFRRSLGLKSNSGLKYVREKGIIPKTMAQRINAFTHNFPYPGSWAPKMKR